MRTFDTPPDIEGNGSTTIGRQTCDVDQISQSKKWAKRGKRERTRIRSKRPERIVKREVEVSQLRITLKWKVGHGYRARRPGIISPAYSQHRLSLFASLRETESI